MTPCDHCNDLTPARYEVWDIASDHPHVDYVLCAVHARAYDNDPTYAIGQPVYLAFGELRFHLDALKAQLWELWIESPFIQVPARTLLLILNDRLVPTAAFRQALFEHWKSRQ